MKLVSQAILVVAAIAAATGGLYLVLRDSTSGAPIEISLPTATAAPPIEIRVYITGAVNEPGVYPADEGDRLAQLIEAAGGATGEADLTAVNLAVRLRDEQHWHIPEQGEAAQAPPVLAQGPSTQGGVAPDKIDLNSADAKLLETLPGIGEVKAQAIIGYRQDNGPFSGVDDLLAVGGIGPATLEDVRDLVEVR